MTGLLQRRELNHCHITIWNQVSLVSDIASDVIQITACSQGKMNEPTRKTAPENGRQWLQDILAALFRTILAADRAKPWAVNTAIFPAKGLRHQETFPRTSSRNANNDSQ